MRYIQSVLFVALALGAFPSAARKQASEIGMDRPRIAIEEKNPWTYLEVNNDPDRFQFAIVTDRTQNHRSGVFEDAIRKLNLLQPEFVVTVGDMIEGYTEDREQIRLEWDEFEGFVEPLEMPFFYVPGNHDISNEIMADEWERRFGRSYYHFVYRDVLFLCLNTEDQKPTHIGQQQRAYIAAVLAENPDVRWTLVFMHNPLWDASEDTGWPAVEELLQGRPHTVFAGHYHTYLKSVRNGHNYFVLATTGGESSRLGPIYGQFDHLVWVTMTDQEPRVVNLMLEGIRDEDIRTERIAALVNPLFGEWSVSMEPVFSGHRVFQRGKTMLRVNNYADVPLQVRGGFGKHPHLEVQPDSVAVIVAPSSLEQVELEVGTRTPVQVEELVPLLLHWNATYEQAEVDLPRIDGTSRLVVSKRFEVPGRVDPVVVDGSLSEWETLPFRVEEPAEIKVDPASWTGPDDCSWRFGMGIGQEYLYIGIEVLDDQPIYTQAVPWQQDGVEVRVDGRPDPVRSNHRWGDDLGMQTHLFVGLSPAEPPDTMITVESERLQALGVRAVCAPTDKGHNTEVAIPLSYFEERQGPEWKAFRLNITVNDFDARPGPLAQLWWQPDWRGMINYAGSGTFRRR